MPACSRLTRARRVTSGSRAGRAEVAPHAQAGSGAQHWCAAEYKGFGAPTPSYPPT